jgi:uncharacterized membrane protein YedE/YeeE
VKQTLVSGLSGLLFGVGLLVSGMTRPSKVVGFLDVTGAWDPSLAFVMMGAIAVHFVAYRIVPRMPSPLLGGSFSIPTRADVDARLVTGAALFGLGWGLGGFCPGPALVTLATGGRDVLVFVGGMLGGMVLFQVVDKALRARSA